MRTCIIQKVLYQPGGSSRLVFAMVLAQREGLSLLLVPAPDGKQGHRLVIASEDPARRLFHDVQTSCFPLEGDDCAEVGSKLQALAGEISRDQFDKFIGG